jgi:hypothetical protein
MSFTAPRYSWWERAGMRLLFAAVVALHIPQRLDYHTLPNPNGLARLLDLTWLLEPAVFTACRYALYLALLLYVLRVAWWVVLPYATFLSVAVGSVANSQGAVGHGLQIVSLVLVAQTAAVLYSYFPNGSTAHERASTLSEERLISWSQQAIAACYLVSGITKLIRSSGAWIAESRFVAVQIVKTNEQRFYDTLDPALAGVGLPLAEWMAQRPLLVGASMTAGLLLELTAPLLLLGRRWAAFYGLAFVAFHESIHRVMNLQFTHNEQLAWIYLVNVPFWIVAAAGWMRLRVEATRP